jgi:DNA-binding response OmpR family regulator
VKLLFVDTDRELIDMVGGWLKTLGYDVDRAFSVEQAKAAWNEQQPDLVIIDAEFGDGNTPALCREMRSKYDTLVMIVADSRDVQEEIRWLESGADDFLRKPFFPSQLLAHIRTLGRRTRSTLQRRPSSIITVGSLCVDSLHNEVTVQGKTSRLTPTESKLLHLLAINANDVCTSSQIVMHVWGYDGEGDSCLIKTHIRHLRQKIEPDPGRPRYIVTLPGVGYSLIHHSKDEEVRESIGSVPVSPGQK